MIMRWPPKWLTRRRVFRGILYGVATLGILIAVFYFEENWRGLRAWNHFRAQAEAKGERFDQSPLAQYSGPDDQNFALSPIVASGYATYTNKAGSRVLPPRANIVNRLIMSLAREDEPPSVVSLK
jgi:hypothetical protein